MSHKHGWQAVPIRCMGDFGQCGHALVREGCALQGHSLIRVLRVAPADCSPPQAWRGWSASLATATESLASATVALSKEVLQRPQARPGTCHCSHSQTGCDKE